MDPQMICLVLLISLILASSRLAIYKDRIVNGSSMKKDYLMKNLKNYKMLVLALLVALLYFCFYTKNVKKECKVIYSVVIALCSACLLKSYMM